VEISRRKTALRLENSKRCWKIPRIAAGNSKSINFIVIAVRSSFFERYRDLHFVPLISAPKAEDLLEAMKSLSATVFQRVKDLREKRLGNTPVSREKKKCRRKGNPNSRLNTKSSKAKGKTKSTDLCDVTADIIGKDEVSEPIRNRDVKQVEIQPTADVDEVEADFDVIPPVSEPIRNRDVKQVEIQPTADVDEVEADFDVISPTSKRKRKYYETPMATSSTDNPPQHNVSERFRNKKRKISSKQEENESAAAEKISGVSQDEDIANAAAVYTLMNMSTDCIPSAGDGYESESAGRADTESGPLTQTTAACALLSMGQESSVLSQKKADASKYPCLI